VCLTVDYDAISLWLMLGSTGAQSISRGEFGVTDGTPRLLDAFDRLGITTSWFIPGSTAAQYPDSVAAVASAGHEIANHGYLHENFAALPIDEARSAILRANEVLERVTGKRPVGVRLPGSDLDGRCLELVCDERFLYDSSLCGGYRAYWARSCDTFDESQFLHHGEPLDLVELPFHYSITDFSHFEINAALGLPAAMPNPRQLEEVWRDELDDLVTREPDGFLMMVVHPQVIGRGSRMAMLERVIRYALDSGFRFVTAETLAREFRAHATQREKQDHAEV
jgi:peptidoglycan/xylan/chitin deacetylase (PgdA/CDA1 family)